MKNTANPQRRDINQDRGPTTGNVATGSKRRDFMAEKSRSNSERSAIADMISDAFAARGQGMKGYRDATVEPVAARVNAGRGPTRGNGGKRSNPRTALGATSGY
jgi:hypothetical protein